MKKLLMPAVLGLLCLPSCTVTPADVSTYQQIGPAHAAYVQADPALTAEQKQRRLDLVESWRIRVGGAK
jgi:hypothetical protein